MKKFITISLASIFGVVLVTSAVLANYGKDNRLFGYVKEYRTLIPLAKAKVKLYKKSGKLKDSDTTNGRGKYKFSDLTEGTYKVKAKVDGYRNPLDFRKDTVSRIIKIDGKKQHNLYLQKI